MAVQTCKVLLLKFPDIESPAVGSPVGMDLIKGLGILKPQIVFWDLSARRLKISNGNGRVHMVVRMQVGDNQIISYAAFYPELFL